MVDFSRIWQRQVDVAERRVATEAARGMTNVVVGVVREGTDAVGITRNGRVDVGIGIGGIGQQQHNPLYNSHLRREREVGYGGYRVDQRSSPLGSQGIERTRNSDAGTSNSFWEGIKNFFAKIGNMFTGGTAAVGASTVATPAAERSATQVVSKNEDVGTIAPASPAIDTTPLIKAAPLTPAFTEAATGANVVSKTPALDGMVADAKLGNNGARADTLEKARGLVVKPEGPGGP